jgi:hypothetical protein
MLVWIPIAVRMIDPMRMLERKTARDDWLARSMPVIRVGSETLNRTLIVAIFRHGIERSRGTRLVENSSESIEVLSSSSAFWDHTTFRRRVMAHRYAAALRRAPHGSA